MDATEDNFAQDMAELDRLGMTQPQIAEYCKCRQTTISALATGKTKDPHYALGKRIKELLRVKRAEAAEHGRPPPAPPHGAGGDRAETAAVGG